MLEQFPVHASVAASDIDRARTWYKEKLGLEPRKTDPGGGMWFEFAGGTWLYVYASGAAGTAQNTVAGWTVKGIESVMAGLRSRGVVFEEYDFPGGLKTVKGLAIWDGVAKAAWFKDSEGNTFELSEVLGGG
ncbi:MAG TPA: VOC family protein [Actinomycetota bacterium]|nr:VOC family protein [Actinomycetota bacterium]